MARRPDVFNQAAFQESLRRLGCTESFISPITSDFKLFVPLALRELGEQQLVEIANKSRMELKLGEQEDAWKVVARYIVAWAEDELDKYKAQK